MKIALLGPVFPFRGGIAHHTTLLAKALSPSHELLTVSFRSQYPGFLYPGRTDRDHSSAPATIAAEYLLHPLLPWTWWQTANRIAHFAPTAVVVQWWTTFWSLADWVLTSRLRSKGIKVIFLIHNVLPHELRPLDGALAALALRQGSAYLAQSNREQSRLQTLLPDARITVCPMPVFTNFRPSHVTRAEARRRLSLPADCPLALFFGIVRPYKGLRYLIQAIAELNKQGRAINLVVAGEFWEDLAGYRRELLDLGIAARVFIHDHYILDEEVPLYFAASNLFVAPYLEATQSAALQAARFFGIPLVITDTICDGEPVAGDVCPPVVVPARDARSLAEGILRALQPCQSAGPGVPEPRLADGWQRLVNTIEQLAAR